MSDEPQTSPVPLAARADLVSTMLEEYRQLYTLVLYRLQVLDQRIPLAAAALTATLGSVVVVPATLQIALLVGIPISVALLFQSTLSHARSLEDALSRIAEIEASVNGCLSRPTLLFQSTHPGRREVGSRTARETADAVLLASLLIVTGCVWFVRGVVSEPISLFAYDITAMLVAFSLIKGRTDLQRYRYLRSSAATAVPL
jgi:hypothetical protein